jgi:CRP-like cAMP-binding protein
MAHLFCLECRRVTSFAHDHNEGRGLDDGPPLFKRQVIESRRRTAVLLRQCGLKQETIADMLDVSRPTIVSDLKTRKEGM